MSAIRGKVTDGKIEIPAPPDWPDGLEVEVRPADEEFGCTEDEQGDDPESIAAWIAQFDARPRLIMSPEEEAEMNEWRQKVKAFNVEAVRRQMEEEETP
jgi:hypothetical protein